MYCAQNSEETCAEHLWQSHEDYMIYKQWPLHQNSLYYKSVKTKLRNCMVNCEPGGWKPGTHAFKKKNTEAPWGGLWLRSIRHIQRGVDRHLSVLSIKALVGFHISIKATCPHSCLCLPRHKRGGSCRITCIRRSICDGATELLT